MIFIWRLLKQSLYLPTKIFYMVSYKVINYAMSDDAILKNIGAQLKQMRINAQLSQKELAKRAGISRSTITTLENGYGASLSTLIAVLRHLQKLNTLDIFATEAPISPLMIARSEGKKVLRVYKPHKSSTNKDRSEW